MNISYCNIFVQFLASFRISFEYVYRRALDCYHVPHFLWNARLYNHFSYFSLNRSWNVESGKASRTGSFPESKSLLITLMKYFLVWGRMQKCPGCAPAETLLQQPPQVISEGKALLSFIETIYKRNKFTRMLLFSFRFCLHF